MRRTAPIEIREAEGGPNLYGVMLQEGRAARRRRELFAPGAVEWPSDGVGILTRHYGEAVVRAVPEREADGRITIKARATEAIREAVASGRRFMSVEFHALRERRTEGGIREVLRALVPDVALVREPEYGQAAAEVRRGLSPDFGVTVRTGKRMDCRCADGDATEVIFDAGAFRGVEGLDVTAIARGAESVIASTATGSLRLRAGADGALAVALGFLDTEAGRRTRELLAAGVAVFARPLWDPKESDWELSEDRAEGGRAVAVVSRAVFKYLLVRPVPEADASGLDALERTKGESRGLSLRRRALIAGAA